MASRNVIRTLPRTVIIRVNVNILTLNIRLSRLVLTQLRLRRKSPRTVRSADRRVFVATAQLSRRLHLRANGVAKHSARAISLRRTITIQCMRQGLIKVEFHRPAWVPRLIVQRVERVDRTSKESPKGRVM